MRNREKCISGYDEKKYSLKEKKNLCAYLYVKH